MQSTRNIHVYRALIPQPEYEKIFAESKSFHYEGKTKAATKIIGGVAAFAPCLVGGAVVGLLTLPGGGGEGPKNAWKFWSKSVNPLREGISRYGYHCQTNIPAAWIQAKMGRDNTEVNPNFDPSPANTPIYIIDAGDSEKIYSEGLNYKPELPLTNPRGGIIYFYNKKDAFQCAALRLDSLLYDENGRQPIHGQRMNEIKYRASL